MSAENMYIVGDAPIGQGWNTWKGELMTDNEDGTFTYEFTATSTADLYFCISPSLAGTTDNDDWSTFNLAAYHPGSKGAELKPYYVDYEVAKYTSDKDQVKDGYSTKLHVVDGKTYTMTFTKSTGIIMVTSDNSADIPELYLRSSLDATVSNSQKTWDADLDDLDDYEFECKGWNSSWKKFKYTYNVTSEQLATMISNGTNDLYFRLEIDGFGYQIKPASNYTFTFSDGKYGSEQTAWSNNNDYKGTDKTYIVSHSTVGASEYMITVLVQLAGWGTTYNTNVEIVSMPVTIGSTGKATFCSSHALDFSDTGISAYTIIDSNKATGVLTTSSALTEVPANTGLYLEGTAKTYEVSVIASASSVGTNMLVGVLSNTHVDQTATVSETEYTNFILTINTVNGNVATPKFYKVNGEEGNTVLAGKAYLQIRTEDAARESFWFDAETTAIEKLTPTISEGVVYDLQGRKVMNPAKGLYIVNGKKVIK